MVQFVFAIDVQEWTSIALLWTLLLTDVLTSNLFTIQVDSKKKFIFGVKGAQTDFVNFFFQKFWRFLVSQESLYFSHNPCQILQLKSTPF